MKVCLYTQPKHHVTLFIELVILWAIVLCWSLNLIFHPSNPTHTQFTLLICVLAYSFFYDVTIWSMDYQQTLFPTTAIQPLLSIHQIPNLYTQLTSHLSQGYSKTCYTFAVAFPPSPWPCPSLGRGVPCKGYFAREFIMGSWEEGDGGNEYEGSEWCILSHGGGVVYGASIGDDAAWVERWLNEDARKEIKEGCGKAVVKWFQVGKWGYSIGLGLRYSVHVHEQFEVMKQSLGSGMVGGKATVQFLNGAVTSLDCWYLIFLCLCLYIITSCYSTHSALFPFSLFGK